MPRNITIATIVTRCKQRADRENDGHISDSEWKSYISEVYGRDVYSTVAESGLRYFETESTVSANGSASYTEPADHLATIGIDRVIDSSGRRDTLREVMAQERSRWLGSTGDAVAYSLVDDKLVLFPNPSSGDYRWLYIPQPPDLSAASDVTNVDVVTADGEAVLLWGVTILAKGKSEEDASLAIREHARAREALAVWASLRAFSQPRIRQVMDGYGDYDHDPADWRWPR